MSRRGLLLTMTEPPPGMEEEFNAWYDDEHLPERLAIPGFRSAQRWVADCKPGEGRYLATYELDSLQVLNSAEYLSFFEKPTPWSRRCLGKTVVFKRWACEQIHPGEADPVPSAAALLFAMEAIPPGVKALQVRRFTAQGESRPIVLCELATAPTRLAGPARVFRRYGT